MAFAQIYTIGFTGKSAETFFGILERHHIKRLVDVRLNNTSQLSAFAKKQDLAFFLRNILDADYVHEPRLAPTDDILKAYQKKEIDWPTYEVQFSALMYKRQVEKIVSKSLFVVPSVLLCSEPTPEKCHRRLVAEYLAQKWGKIEINHL